MVDGDGLENRCSRKGTVGSNPTPSAITGPPPLLTFHRHHVQAGKAHRVQAVSPDTGLDQYVVLPEPQRETGGVLHQYPFHLLI